jgi:hypothetical protein
MNISESLPGLANPQTEHHIIHHLTSSSWIDIAGMTIYWHAILQKSFTKTTLVTTS